MTLELKGIVNGGLDVQEGSRLLNSDVSFDGIVTLSALISIW